MDSGSTRAYATPHQHLAETAIRGTALFFDLQLQTARDLLAMQARGAAAFGMPDCSSLFAGDDERAQRMFSESAEQLIASARSANEIIAALNRQTGRLLERQATGAARQLREGLEQLVRNAQEHLLETRSLLERDEDKVERAAQQARQYASEQPGWQQAASRPLRAA